MGANSVVHPCEPLSHDMVQKWINKGVEGANIPGSFSTHCYRCGGAQYCFMFAPIGQHWMLAKVCWWGGWAEQEHVGLLFSLTHHELRLTWVVTCHSMTPSSTTFWMNYTHMRATTVMHWHPSSKKSTSLLPERRPSFSQCQPRSCKQSIHHSWATYGSFEWTWTTSPNLFTC